MKVMFSAGEASGDTHAASVANALSDVYAMGGTPLTAMNIVGFPVPLVEQGVLTDVLNGAGSIVAEAGAAIVGGHSIENKEPIFGISVTGQVNPNQIWKNKGAQVGDVLVLTKRIGTDECCPRTVCGK